jgi:hypothetical protein
MFLYQYLLYCLLALQKTIKRPKNALMAKIMKIFLKRSEIGYFPGSYLIGRILQLAEWNNRPKKYYHIQEGTKAIFKLL